MRKKILTILGALLLICILYLKISSSEIEGVWVNSHYHSMAVDVIFPGKSIVKYYNHKVNGYSHHMNPNNGNGYFFFIKNYAWVWTNLFDIHKIQKIPLVYDDSLVLEIHQREKYIFKKVDDSLKNDSKFKFSFKNKAFHFKNKHRKGKIYFGKEHFFVKLNSPDYDWHMDAWESVQIDDFDFLVFKNESALIIKENNGTPLLYRFENGNHLDEINLKRALLDSTELRNIREKIEAYNERRGNK